MASSPVNYADPIAEPAKNRIIIYLALILGGIALIVVLFGIAGLVFYYRSNNPNNLANANSAPSVPTLGAKAQKAEEKVLRGEILSENDIEGLSAEELRIVRNVHFARYGRKYERPGLGDYFYNQSWYKPSDGYNDRMVTKTDKANIDLILAKEKDNSIQTINPSTSTPQTEVPVQPTATPPTYADDGKLSTEKAQRTLDRWSGQNPEQLRVLGIQEIPNQNAARANLRFNNFQNKNYSGSGFALFTHYNDGRWVLTHVSFGEGITAVYWAGLNVEAR